jgi:hypothetical protein
LDCERKEKGACRTGQGGESRMTNDEWSEIQAVVPGARHSLFGNVSLENYLHFAGLAACWARAK